jgi:BirA family biotin operon repressor/biotin-[acetyl-CoA-carboxylase] ligase
MASEHTPLDSAEITRGLAEAGVPWALMCLSECDSTNREAFDRAAADPALVERGLAVFAGWQSAGRGRRGARWQSEPEADLLFSVAFRPALPTEHWSRLTHAAALAVSKALEPTWQGSIKWPNDVYLGGRKLAGILLEGHPAEGLAVIGIGLNVNSDPSDLGDELAAPATSLRAQSGADVDRDALVVRLLSELHSAVSQAGEAFPVLMAEISERSLLVGEDVTLEASGEHLIGRVSGFGAEGELLLDLPDGSTRELNSADRVRLSR